MKVHCEAKNLSGALRAPLNVAGRFDPQESCAQRMKNIR